MGILFDNFEEWKSYASLKDEKPYMAVLEYEMDQRGKTEAEIWEKLAQAYAVMKDAVQTGLSEDMQSISGMINNGAKKVRDCKISVLGRR